MIKHEPNFNVEKIAKAYTERDGVPVKYVCSSALGSEEFAMDIFYRDTPHPEFGNRYFGVYMCPIRQQTYITNADKIDGQCFDMIRDTSGNYHYSAHRHDYKVIDGSMIDGGRAYTRASGSTYSFILKDGEFSEQNG